MASPDYAISCVIYRPAGSIEFVGVRPYANKTQASEEWSRARVIEELDAGKTFVTVYRDGFDLKDGSHVHDLRIGTKRFISTDPNQSTEDNLAGLKPCPGSGDVILP